MVTHNNRFIWMCLLFVIFIPGKSIQCADLTDSRKKEIVGQLYNGYKADFPEVEDIAPTEVIRLINQNKVVLIDVRRPAEREISMLPGAISKDDYLTHMNAYKGLTAVAYCTIGYRSGKFAEKMVAKGIGIKNMAGGLLAWLHDGGWVYHEGKEVKRIHVYGPRWDYPPEGYESIRFGLFERLF